MNTPLLRELFAADPERAQRPLVHVPMGPFADPGATAARGGAPAPAATCMLLITAATSRLTAASPAPSDAAPAGAV